MSYIKKLLLAEKKVGVKCDLCNNDCTENFADLSGIWGEGSKYDGEKHYCHFCEKCYNVVKKTVEDMNGKVIVERYLPHV